jgi:hypothetical protein
MASRAEARPRRTAESSLAELIEELSAKIETGEPLGLSAHHRATCIDALHCASNTATSVRYHPPVSGRESGANCCSHLRPLPGGFRFALPSFATIMACVEYPLPV